MENEIQRVSEMVRAFALDLPGAVEEFPWGERVIKVNKKIFVFLGLLDNPGTELFIGLKLPESHRDVLNLPYTKPSGYGLGKYGWVQFRFPPEEIPPVDLIEKWIMESYRAVAGKKQSALLDKAATANRSLPNR